VNFILILFLFVRLYKNKIRNLIKVLISCLLFLHLTHILSYILLEIFGQYNCSFYAKFMFNSHVFIWIINNILLYNKAKSVIQFNSILLKVFKIIKLFIIMYIPVVPTLLILITNGFVVKNYCYLSADLILGTILICLDMTFQIILLSVFSIPIHQILNSEEQLNNINHLSNMYYKNIGCVLLNVLTTILNIVTFNIMQYEGFIRGYWLYKNVYLFCQINTYTIILSSLYLHKGLLI